MKVAADTPFVAREGGSEVRMGLCQTQHLSQHGGLRQFGAFVERLHPGAFTSDRHWHAHEDEFLFVLEGRATLIDERGAQEMGPGDAVCWPHGAPNGHQIVNRSDAPVSHVIVGSRVAGDICTYPDLDEVLVNGQTGWQVIDGAGTVLRSGALPPELLGLAPVWGTAWEPGVAFPPIQRAAGRIWQVETGYAHPILGGGLGDYRHCVLGDPGHLSQFGVHLEDLPPGARSSFRHWHEAEDEMVLVLSGTPTLVEETETRLAPGDAACWPAGHPVGHQLRNDGDAPAVYLIIGTRLPRDVIHYPDHDLITHKDGAARRYTHADGRPRGAAP